MASKKIRLKHRYIFMIRAKLPYDAENSLGAEAKTPEEAEGIRVALKKLKRFLCARARKWNAKEVNILFKKR